MEALLKELKICFRERFGADPDVFGWAPGRVNLIGEHIDYNGGHVFPCALTLGTAGAVRRRTDGILRFYSLNFKGIGTIEMRDGLLENDPRDHWSNYAKGMLQVLRAAGHSVDGGFDLMMNGNIPTASGLSSSASVEVLTGVLLRELYHLPLSNEEIALLAQKAENEFIGLNCGIMDQYIIACGLENRAMLLDTAALKSSFAPLELGDYRLLISSSNKKRGLSHSAYNERRAECEEALRDLQTVNSQWKNLCAVTPAEFEEASGAIKREICRRRARHAVYEEERTKEAFQALEDGNLVRFGALMTRSHASLRDLYEVSCRELDVLVELALADPSCLGARMTGAGFGGCTVSLVKKEQAEALIKRIAHSYEQTFGWAADFYLVVAGSGARAWLRAD